MLKFLQETVRETWNRAVQSFWTFFGYFLSQVGLQALNMITGFVIIRVLTKDDYADYTIVNTLVPVMLMLSDNGIGTGISAIGRHIWEDDEKIGRLVNTGLQLRRSFAMVSFIIVEPFLAWMLFRNHASILTIVLLTGVTLVGISFQLTTAVMKTVLQLRQKIRILATAGIVGTCLRAGLVFAFILLFHFSAFLATLAGTCSVFIEMALLMRALKPQIAWRAAPDPEYRKEMLSLVKKTMPLVVYFCVQGQINIWLISLFGNAHQVADIGAVGRLGIIFSTLAGTYSTIMVPRFARSNGRRRLVVQYWQIVISLTLMLLAFVLFTWFFPEPFILLLGPKYLNMSGLLWLVVLSSGLSALSGVTFSLNMCKGWIPPALITVPIEMGTQIALLLTLNLSKTENVLIFSSLATIPPTILSSIILFRRLRLEPEA